MDDFTDADVASYVAQLQAEQRQDVSRKRAGGWRSILLTRRTLRRAVWLSWTIGFLAAGARLTELHDARRVAGLPLSRVLLLLGLIPSVWYLPWYFMFLLVMGLEAHMGTAESGQLVYNLLGIRVSLGACQRDPWCRVNAHAYNCHTLQLAPGCHCH